MLHPLTLKLLHSQRTPQQIGTLALFNLQSGARRGVFPHDASVKTSGTARGQLLGK